MATKTQKPVKAESKDPNKTTKNTIKKNDSPKKILAVLKSTKNALIIMDSRFDYDALGSVLAFSDALKQLKVPHKCIYGYEIPTKPKEYFNTTRIQENVDLKSFDYTPYDLLVFLDSGTLEHHTKAHDFQTPARITTLNIDHHVGNSLYGTINYVEVKASTGSVIYNLFDRRHIDITPQMADYLLACQIADTGLLQYNSVNSEELRIIADLIDRGGDYFKFMDFLTMNEGLDDMIVKGLVYSNLRIDRARRFAYSVLSEDMVKEKGGLGYGVVPADLIKKLKDIDFVFVVKTDSQVPDKWHISLRSHDMGYDVLKIAQKLNGGGHKVAAGCSIPFSDAKTVEEVAEKIWQIASGIKDAS